MHASAKALRRPGSGIRREFSAPSVGFTHVGRGWISLQVTVVPQEDYAAARPADSPHVGRWLSNDPIGISGGLNQYTAFGNNPVMVVDPWGEQTLNQKRAALVRQAGRAVIHRYKHHSVTIESRTPHGVVSATRRTGYEWGVMTYYLDGDVHMTEPFTSCSNLFIREEDFPTLPPGAIPLDLVHNHPWEANPEPDYWRISNADRRIADKHHSTIYSIGVANGKYTHPGDKYVGRGAITDL